jgi:hypothetical protein
MSYEADPVDPLRIANDSAGEAWLHGYGDAYAGRDLNEPDSPYRLEYLRGYVSGLKALRS